MYFIVWLFGHLLFWVSFMHVFLYFCICTWSVQLRMIHIEKRSRNTVIIVVVVVLIIVCFICLVLFCFSLAD